MHDPTLYQTFAEVAEARADASLLIRPGKAGRSYGEVFQSAATIAAALAGAGAVPGDRVSVQVDKSADALSLYLGCLHGGFVFHPLNPAYTRDELAFLLGDAEPAVVVSRPGAARIPDELAPAAARLTLGAGGGTLLEAAAACTPVAAAVRRSDSLVALLYSSGTTGKPKGIPLTNANLLDNARALTALWAFGRDDVLIHALPFFHVHGLFIALGCALSSGAALRWLPAFDVDAVLAGLPDATVFMGVPTYYSRLLADSRLDAERCRPVRLFVSGSAPLPAGLYDAFERRTGRRILERYGMTETSVITSNTLDDRRRGSVGRPLPGVELRIVAADGRPSGPGRAGHIQVRGRSVFGGYWRGAAEAFTADGFFDTGDMGRQDADGFVTIVGRSKDLIISGGMNVYPAEVEAVIENQPLIREAAVVGVPHPDFGEAVVACVVANGTLETTELLAALRERLAAYKRPKHIEVLTELPRNTMGKVQKAALRARLRTLFVPGGEEEK